MNRFQQELEAFAASEWGKATTTQDDTAGLCKRATLALLARLETAGLTEGAELWNLTGAVEGKGRGPDQRGTHWVLVRDGEAIDVSARQFDPDGPYPRRGPARDELARWHHDERVDPDGEDMWDKGFLRRRAIPPYWRDRLQARPPGDLPDWPYPRDALVQTSRWYCASSQ